MVLADVFLACMTHACTTESEEIMGVLLGDIKVLPSAAFALPAMQPLCLML